jgi:hypothetical protein
MNYKSFTQKQKLPNANLFNGVQANQISLQKWMENQIKGRILNTQPRGQNINLSTNWDSEWEDMTTVMSGSVVLAVYKTWNVLIGDINYNWLNRFTIEIVCRNGVDGDGDSTGFQVSPSIYFKKFSGWDIKDLISNPASNTKTIRLLASLFSYNNGVLPVFQAKLLVKYIDQVNRD